MFSKADIDQLSARTNKAANEIASLLFPLSAARWTWLTLFGDEDQMRSEVRELLVEQLKDAYSAEKQALRCMSIRFQS